MNKDAVEVQKQVSKFVNSFSTDSDEFIKLMLNDHRTLQQSFTRLCLQWIEAVAKEDYRHDLRNQRSHEVCRYLIYLWKEDKLNNADFLPSQQLPMI